MTEKRFKQVYQQYGSAIRNYIYYRSGDVYLADDITQETFIKLWNKRNTFTQDYIKALLYKIAGGIFLDYIRRYKIETDYVEQSSFKLKENVAPSSENEVCKKRCEKALKVLTEKERIVFLMHKKDGIKYKEIAENLAISVKTVEKRMSTAIRKLKQNRNEDK